MGRRKHPRPPAPPQAAARRLPPGITARLTVLMQDQKGGPPVERVLDFEHLQFEYRAESVEIPPLSTDTARYIRHELTGMVDIYFRGRIVKGGRS